MARAAERNRRSWRLLGAVVVVTVALLGAACSGDDDSDEGAADQTTISSSTSTTEAELTPQSGGELVVGLSGDVLTLDPAGIINHAPSRTLAMAIYDPLLEIAEDGTVRPYLAASFEVNDDDTVFTLELRDGVTFHDGTPLDSAAVAALFARMQDPATASQAYANVSRITSIETPDPLTVVFTVDEPWPAFPTVVLADHPGLMASPTAIAQYGADYSAHAVGTGPFRLVTYAPGDQYVVERNPDYWQEGLPYLDRITYRGIPDEQTRFQSLQAGDVDLIQSLNAGVAAQAEGAGLTSQVNLGIGSTEVVLNTERLSDPEVRRGLSLAIDRDAINDVVNDGASKASTGPLQDGSPYYGDVAFPQFDQAEAASLLEGENLSISLVTTPDPGATRAAELIQQMWTAVGVDASIEPLDQGQVVSRTQAGDFDASLYIGQEVFDPDALSARFATDGDANNSFYSNPEVDAAFAEARTLADPAARTAAYQGILDQLAEDAPVIYLLRKVGVFAAEPSVQGIPGHEPVGVQIFRPTEIWLQQ